MEGNHCFPQCIERSCYISNSLSQCSLLSFFWSTCIEFLVFDRKNDVAKRPSKKPCHASSKSCTSSVVSSPNVWADLLDCLLHQIIALLSSSNDIIAFAATCRSWRAAFTSFPSTLSCNVPPLCLQSHIHYPHRGHSRIKYSLLYNCEW